jgi:hypothetical protein
MSEINKILYKTKFGSSWYPGCVADIDNYHTKVFLFENEENNCSKPPFVYLKAAIMDGDKIVWSGDYNDYINRPAVKEGQKLVGCDFVGIGIM